MKKLIVILSLLLATTASARDTMTGIFNERVRTLRVQLGDNPFAPPMVIMGSNDFLTISFDHLSDDREFLRYRVVRCDANWQPSTLAEVEYLDGFNESMIEEYDYSNATTVHYVHYSFQFPNYDISPKLSGNYLIEVYPENDPESIWFQTRVMLSEQCAPIEAGLSTVTDIDYNDSHQQLAIRIDSERAGVNNPYNDLTVMISQNGRADNEIALSHPLRVSNKTAIYEHQRPLIFEAGNEYRRMEVSSVHYPGMGVESIDYSDPYYHFKLYTDQARAGEAYLYDQTQHGRFFIREYNSSDSDVDADYVVVHFSLEYPELPGTMIFLDGDFTSRRFDPSSIMSYNQATGCYEKVLLLKQGAYNYQYLAVPQGKQSGTTSIIEGNNYQTSNEYLIKVYTRGPLDRTDRLIGVTMINSEP